MRGAFRHDSFSKMGDFYSESILWAVIFLAKICSIRYFYEKQHHNKEKEMSLGLNNSNPELTVYKLYDANAPVIIFEFPEDSTLAKPTQDRISLLCMNTNEYLGPILSKERSLTEEEKNHVFELLRYDCTPKEAKGTVFGYSQKPSGYYPIGHTITTTDDLFHHVIGQLNHLKKDDIIVKEITTNDLYHGLEDPRFGYTKK
jgi:hypothetical protein